MGRIAAGTVEEQVADADEAKEAKDAGAEKARDVVAGVAVAVGDWVVDPVFACVAGGIALGKPQLLSFCMQGKRTIRLIY